MRLLCCQKEIDDTQAERNIYWDCYNGYRNLIHDNKTDELANSFKEVEQYFYTSEYQNFVNNQNARNKKIVIRNVIVQLTI